MATEESVTQTLAFLLGKLGQVASGRFAARLAPLGLRPRHCALLELLAHAPKAQLELAHAIGVTPSVVVDMLDELEQAEAVRRVRDSTDRRRQLIELTTKGRRLRRRAVALARETDEEMLAGFDTAQAAALRTGLLRIADSAGLFGSVTRPS
ncbi:MarR family winged helix-turn-helix transcriptional regulator [Micromonospora globispora]|uniref:MarR family winged helix-turn-helix transcriptional regulator n=1 Tax=Micromonospora globispora TaxID=1450148 RepID=UPI001402292F|nr:MarR family transcriptional regulator [Micromonospora globispora]